MKNIKAAILTLALLVTGMAATAAVVSVYRGYLVNGSLAASVSYDIDTNAQDMRSLSAQAAFSTATIAAVSFGDGQVSTGSITFADASLASLTTAYASNKFTVVSTTGLNGAALVFSNGVILKEGIDWKKGINVSSTAINLQAALLRAFPDFGLSRVAGVVFATAPVAGEFYNSLAVHSTTPTALSVDSAAFTGGQDNAILTINGVPLRHNKEWFKGASSATAAISLAAAINGHAKLSPLVTATATDNVVTLASDKVGALMNFSLGASSPTATVLSGAAMINGADSDYALSGHILHIPDHGFPLALPVLFSTGSLAIGGLADQTTYYAIPVDADSLALASSADNAAAGTYITFTSSATPTAEHTYTLAPLGVDGTYGLIWQASNDYSTWTDLAVDSVTYALSGSAAAGSKFWDLGTVNYRYVRLSVVGPSAGAVNTSVIVNGRR